MYLSVVHSARNQRTLGDEKVPENDETGHIQRHFPELRRQQRRLLCRLPRERRREFRKHKRAAVVSRLPVAVSPYAGAQFNSFVEISTDFSTEFSTEFL